MCYTYAKKSLPLAKRMARMKGWLVVNGLLQSNKFAELYALFGRAAELLGMALECKTSTELFGLVEGGFEETFSTEGKPDFVLFWDKDYALAKRLEQAGLRLFNGAEGVRLADDKRLTALALAGKVKTPKTMVAPMTFEGVGYTDLSFLRKAGETLGFPVVVKEAFGSFGRQVYLAQDEKELSSLVAGFGYKPFLLQEFIAESRGKDMRVNVIGDTVCCAFLRENKDDFRSNITNGGTGVACVPTEKQAQVAVAACKALGLDFAGVDLLLGEGGEPIVCEVNSNPHFKSAFEITGLDMSVEILRYIGEQLA